MTVPATTTISNGTDTLTVNLTSSGNVTLASGAGAGYIGGSVVVPTTASTGTPLYTGSTTVTVLYLN
jgi:hypothetical protein